MTTNRSWDNKDSGKERDYTLEALARIVAAYVGNHTMDPSSVTAFIQQTYTALCNLQSSPNLRNLPQSPVDIEMSVTSEYIVCLEDGKHLKMLKRHLRTAYGMTPEQYRERWGLPVDYPMVAPNYAKRRSTLAKNNRLGHARTRYTNLASLQMNQQNAYQERAQEEVSKNTAASA